MALINSLRDPFVGGLNSILLFYTYHPPAGRFGEDEAPGDPYESVGDEGIEQAGHQHDGQHPAADCR